MRYTLISLLPLALGCVYDPVEIARYTAAEDDTDSNVSWGVGSYERNEVQLRNGTTIVVDLGILDFELLASGVGVHRVVIELVPLQPMLPAGFTASIDRSDGEPITWGEGDDGFEPFGAGLRYEGDLKLGWMLLLHAEEASQIEVRARIVSP